MSLKMKPMVKARGLEGETLSCFTLGFNISFFFLNKEVLLCNWSSVTPFFSQMRIPRLKNIGEWRLSQFSVPGIFYFSLLVALLSCSVPLMSSDPWEKKDKAAFSCSTEPYSILLGLSGWSVLCLLVDACVFIYHSFFPSTQ